MVHALIRNNQMTSLKKWLLRTLMHIHQCLVIGHILDPSIILFRNLKYIFQMLHLKLPSVTMQVPKLIAMLCSVLFNFQLLIKSKAAQLNTIPGGWKFADPYLDVTKRKFWGAADAPNFLSFNIIILNIFCENLAYVGPSLQIL